MTAKFRILSLIVLSVIILSMALGISVGAAEDIEANKALAIQKHSALLSIQDEYYSLGDVGKSANEYVNQYSKYFNTLNDFVLGQDGANVLINLYYEQGVTAGHLAFIYYSYDGDPRLTDEGREVIKDAHDSLQAQIYAAKTAEEISSVSEKLFSEKGIYAQMFVTIYDSMLDALLVENDSNSVIQKIAVAREEIKACTVVRTNEQYEEIYNRALAEVMIQRNKDSTIAEIGKIFSILRPGESIETNSAAMAAIEYIRRDTTTDAADMNAYLKSFVDPLLAEKKDGGAYVDRYVDGLITLIAETVATADSEGRAAMISPILENFALDIKKAATKDIITSDIASREYAADDKMVSLESSYNADGGIIDSCQSEEELAFESERASLRADLYGQYVLAGKRILSFGSFDSLVTEAARKYSYYDYNILSKDPASEGAMESCILEYETFLSELDDLVTSAESTAYINKHSAIIGKDLSEITVADKDAILSAITDATNLSEASADFIEGNGTVDKLAEKYKEISKQIIEKTLGEERKLHAYELKDQIGRLSASSEIAKLTALVEAADGIVKRAELIDSVLDLHSDIKSSKKYKDFSADNKALLDKIATDAANAIVGESDVAEAEKLATDAAIALSRAEACAILDALVSAISTSVSADTLAAINSTVGAAKDKIDLLTTADEIKKATELCEFEVGKEITKDLLDGVATSIKNDIDALGFISDADKSAYKNRIDELLSELNGDMADAKDEAEKESAIKKFSDRLYQIKDEAEEKNNGIRDEENKEAFSKLDEKLAECIDRIDALKFLSDDKKASLKAEAETLTEKAKESLTSSKGSDESEEIFDKAISDIETLTANAESEDTEIASRERAALDKEIKAKYDALINKLYNLEYLSDLIENELKINAGNVYKAFSDQLDNTPDREALSALGSDTAARLDKIGEEADKHQLEGAKRAAKDSVEARAAEAKKKIMGFKHLDADTKSDLVDEIDATVENALSHIDIAPDIPTVKAIEGSAFASISATEDRGQKLEDEAFVQSLMPLIIALACIGAVEAIIAAAIFIYKKKTLLAVAIPTVAPVLALSPIGAQIIAILLALVDLALAVYIGYWVVILYHAWKRDREGGEEEEAFEGLAVDEEPDFEIEIVEIPDEPEEEPEIEIEIVEIEEEPEVEEEIVEVEEEIVEVEEEPVTDIMYEPMIDTVESVTVEEAEEMMTDEEAIGLEQLEIDFAPEFREKYHGTKKAEINIDTIGACFSAGDKVTLNTLKEKGLISRQAGCVKILARGRLDKPLTVVAQKFSVAAVKMILLTGGSVVIAEQAPERK